MEKMTEPALEQLVPEKQFAGLLQGQARSFFQLSNTLLPQVASDRKEWNKKHYNQLINESDELETFLDDFGAGYNKTFSYLRELIASLRWFAHAGYSISHLIGRIDSYGVSVWGPREATESARRSIESGLAFISETILRILASIRDEAQLRGMDFDSETFPEDNFTPIASKMSACRNRKPSTSNTGCSRKPSCSACPSPSPSPAASRW
jgi:hypothetical protein